MIPWPFPGRLAQLGERRLDKAEVTGSSPVSPIDERDRAKRQQRRAVLAVSASYPWSSAGHQNRAWRTSGAQLARFRGGEVAPAAGSGQRILTRSGAHQGCGRRGFTAAVPTVGQPSVSQQPGFCSRARPTPESSGSAFDGASGGFSGRFCFDGFAFRCARRSARLLRRRLSAWPIGADVGVRGVGPRRVRRRRRPTRWHPRGLALRPLGG